MNLYVSTNEIKTYVGISGSSQDALIAMLNKQATAVVNGILSSSDLSLHKVSNEIHNSIGRVFYLADHNVKAIDSILDDDEEYLQDEDYDFKGSTLFLEDRVGQGYRKLKITYAAGWNAYGMATITVTDYASIGATATITLGAIQGSDGYTLTRGTDWTAGTSNDEEATKIATAINAKLGTKAFAIQNVVYVIEDISPQVEIRTLTTSDSTRLTASASTLGSIDFPEDIRGAVMLLVSSMLHQRKNPKMKSYTIGQKQVTFATEDEFKTFKNMLAPYMRARVLAI